LYIFHLKFAFQLKHINRLHLNMNFFKIASYFTLFFAFLFCTSCQHKERSNNQNPTTDITVGDTVKNEYAKAFRVIKFDDYQQIDIINPVDGKVAFRYQIGGKDKEGITQLSTSIQRVIALSSTHIGMMQKLQVADRIVGISSRKYLCEDLFNKDIFEMGSLGSANPELFVQAKPDLIMDSGFDLKAPVINKLKQAGLTIFFNYDWKEYHPLGRAEWIKVYGVLFNKEKEAQEIFKNVDSLYHQMKENISRSSQKIKTFAGTYFGDIFNVPAGESYMAQLFKDAHLDYVYSNTEGTGSLSLTLEEALIKNASIGYWLNVAASSKKEILQQSERFQQLKSLQDGKVYTYMKNNNCFWERSVIEPHLLLHDLGVIFYPELMESHELLYYTKIDE